MADRQQRMSTQSVSWEVEETDDPISGRITQVDESTIKLPGHTCSFDERSSLFTASLSRSNSVSLALRAQELSVAAADGMRQTDSQLLTENPPHALSHEAVARVRREELWHRHATGVNEEL